MFARPLPDVHQQAEGVAITKDSILIVSDEAKARPGGRHALQVASEMSKRHRAHFAIGVAAAFVAFGLAIPAQHSGSRPRSESQTGERHRRRRRALSSGRFHRWLLGANYRDLWTTPIRVPLFDWHSFAGGLHPTKEGGGNQTKSLRFETAGRRRVRLSPRRQDGEGP